MKRIGLGIAVPEAISGLANISMGGKMVWQVLSQGLAIAENQKTGIQAFDKNCKASVTINPAKEEVQFIIDNKGVPFSWVKKIKLQPNLKFFIFLEGLGDEILLQLGNTNHLSKN